MKSSEVQPPSQTVQIEESCGATQCFSEVVVNPTIEQMLSQLEKSSGARPRVQE